MATETREVWRIERDHALHEDRLVIPEWEMTFPLPPRAATGKRTANHVEIAGIPAEVRRAYPGHDEVWLGAVFRFENDFAILFACDRPCVAFLCRVAADEHGERLEPYTHFRTYDGAHLLDCIRTIAQHEGG